MNTFYQHLPGVSGSRSPALDSFLFALFEFDATPMEDEVLGNPKRATVLLGPAVLPSIFRCCGLSVPSRETGRYVPRGPPALGRVEEKAAPEGDAALLGSPLRVVGMPDLRWSDIAGERDGERLTDMLKRVSLKGKC
jgi:hypothetical protein